MSLTKISSFRNDPTLDRQIAELTRLGVSKDAVVSAINSSTEGIPLSGEKVSLTSDTIVDTSFKLSPSNLGKIRTAFIVSGDESVGIPANNGGIRRTFYIPDGATIVSAKLSAKGLPFRREFRTAEDTHSHTIDLTHRSFTVNNYPGTDYVAQTHSAGSSLAASGTTAGNTHRHGIEQVASYGYTPTVVYVGRNDNNLGGAFWGGPATAPDNTTPYDIMKNYDCTTIWQGGGWKELWFDTYRDGRISYTLWFILDLPN